MSNDETMVDDTIEETQEDIIEETVDETDNSAPTLEDYERLLKEKKTLMAQREHWKKKATVKTETKETNKPNEISQSDDGLTEQKVEIMFLKRDGYSDEEIAKLKMLQAGAKAEGRNISLVDATNDELFVALRDKQKLDETRRKAQLGSSTGSGGVKQKQMTPEEHAAYAREESLKLLSQL